MATTPTDWKASLPRDRKARIKWEAGPALYRVMTPGDDIVAGVFAETGPPPVAARSAGLALIVPSLAPLVHDLTHWSANWAPVPRPYGFFLPMAFPLLSLSLPFINRPVFLAVTGEQVICYRMSRSGHPRPSRLLFAAPLAAVRVTRCRPGGLWSSLDCEAPWPHGGSTRRLWVHHKWKSDFDELVTTLSVAGAVTPG